MAVKDFLNPAQISAIVSQQAVARGIGLEIRSRARVDIVVDFQISDAKLLNKALNDLVGMTRGLPDFENRADSARGL